MDQTVDHQAGSQKDSPSADGWTMKLKGSGRIHTHPQVQGAIVDRRGYGLTAALGSNITWGGKPFPSVAAAKAAALAQAAPGKGDPSCRTCGEHYAPYGDGYDGECPACADKTDQALHADGDEDEEAAVDLGELKPADRQETAELPEESGLRECPFCGFDVQLQRFESGLVGIRCTSDKSTCRGSGLMICFSQDNEIAALKQWNRRAESGSGPAADMPLRACDVSTFRNRLVALEGFTPGPWEVFSFEGAIGVTPAAPGDADVAHCDGFCTRRSEDVVRANAGLMAASPELQSMGLRLCGEHDRLRRAVAHANDHADAAIAEMDAMRAEMERLRAENARLSGQAPS